MCFLYIKVKWKKVVWICDVSILRNWIYLWDVSGELCEYVDSCDLIVE